MAFGAGLAVVVLVGWLAGEGSALFPGYPRPKDLPVRDGDPGEPLFLSPYIRAGDAAEGREAARAPLHPAVESYSGFLTVNEAYRSNMFFWFFPAEKAQDEAPLVLWLQGGPGGSSLFGLFSENGPFYVDKNGGLQLREHSWSRDFNLLFIDNPVGTGFSFTKHEDGYATDEIRVGEDLHSAMVQFLELFPHLKGNEFYITGESYAGKYVPALAYTIHRENYGNGPRINLKGIAMGDGYSAPDLMLGYGDYLYQIGLIDRATKEKFDELEAATGKYMAEKRWLEAGENLGELMGGNLFYNATLFTNMYNYLYSREEEPYGDMDVYLGQASVRKTIHVGRSKFHTGEKVHDKLKFDFPQSVKPWIEELLEEYRVMIFTGQLDIIVAYPLQLNFLNNLDWSGADLYKVAPRKPWYVGEQLAGYSKKVKGLTELLVRNAGHMVPMDQPAWAHDMIRRFVRNKPF